MSYRDDRNLVSWLFSSEELRQSQVLLRSSDFPWFIALFLKKNEVLATLRLLRVDEANDLLVYRLVFLINLGGRAANDYRYIDIYTSIDSATNRIRLATNESSWIEFDNLSFRVSILGAQLRTIELFLGQRTKRAFNISNELRRAARI